MFFTKYYTFSIKTYLVKKMIRIYRRDKPEFQRAIVEFLTLKWVLKRYFISLEEYKKLNPDSVDFIFKKKRSLYHSAVNFHGSQTGTNLQKSKEINNYAALVKNVSVISGSNLIILNSKYVFYDLKEIPENTNIDFTDHGISFHKNDHCIIQAKINKIVFEEAILLTGNYDTNLYHFIFEILARFEALDSLNLPLHIPLLVNKACLSYPQYVESLKHFNKQNREIILLNKMEIYEVKNLYFLSCPNIIPPNYLQTIAIKSNQNLFDIDNLSFLRNKFFELIVPVNFPKKIFISRKNASGRREYNEKEIYDFLEQKGFQIMYPAEHSIAGQASIFNNAEIIVGATGAAFSNILFCKKNCKIICLTNYKIDLSIFSTIASFVEANLEYLFDAKLQLEKTSDIHSNFIIDINELSDALNN